MIFCVGVGFGGAKSLTLEAAAAIIRSEVTVYTTETASIRRALEPFTTCRWIDATSDLAFGRLRKDCFRRMAARVLAAAREASPVCWVTAGHPGLLCGVTAQLLAERRRSVRLIGGLSSVDYLLSTAQLAQTAGNLLICTARSIVSGEIRLSPRLPALILQASRCDTDLCTAGARPKEAAYAKLVRALQRTYAASQVVVAFEVERGDKPGIGTSTCNSTVGRVDEVFSAFSSSVSLFLPGARNPNQGRQTATQRSVDQLSDLFETPIERYVATLARKR